MKFIPEVLLSGSNSLLDPKEGKHMMRNFITRRTVLTTAGSSLVVAGSGLLSGAHAQGLAPTPTMRGGSNNYLPGAAIVEKIGGGGFWMTGTVRHAADGAPLPGQRIQIWAHTTEGHERDPESHGATLTDANGVFRLEMPQIVPAFGQAHGHLVHDGDDFETVFLRPVMRSPSDTTLNVDFVLVSV
ncbi:MAG: protocatechuate 3,4-dioxygenase beta subunit [Yoonia sp.]